MNRRALMEMLLRHEGCKLKPYKDARGRLTIGVGRCLETKGILKEEALLLFEADVTEAIVGCMGRIACFRSLDDVRQHVLVDMAFNLGVEGLLAFHKMFTALEARDFVAAAREMRDSRWYREVGERGEELAGMMEKG